MISRRTAPPSDGELAQLLGDDDETAILSRHPYRYATSAPLEELHVRTGGRELALILKDLSPDRLLDDAYASRPLFLYQPAREIETYRKILAPAHLGPEFIAALSQADPPRHWLLIEKVPGVELWQVGELAVWEAVAAWLGRFHARFAERLDDVSRVNPHLLDYSVQWFEAWCERARTALEPMRDPRASRLARALERYDEVISALEAMPRTLVHGELYPSNVLVAPGECPVRVCPVDWEMAGIGPGMLDLAALVGGWSHAERDRLVRAYLEGLAHGDPVLRVELPDAGLGACRLHLALQWLGWSTDWRPPPEHAHDWLGEALGLSEELGLA
jgi:Phosphotransferase enzyme family